MSQHRSTTPTHDRLDHLPLKVMVIERDLAAHVASCRECKSRRVEWERAMATELAEFRATVAGALATIGKQLIDGMGRLERRLDAGSKRKDRK